MLRRRRLGWVIVCDQLSNDSGQEETPLIHSIREAQEMLQAQALWCHGKHQLVRVYDYYISSRDEEDEN